jgi:hypothetical protein
MIFIVEYRSPTMYWEDVDTVGGEKLQVMMTDYKTLEREMEADSLTEAVDLAQLLYDGVKRVYPKEPLTY